MVLGEYSYKKSRITGDEKMVEEIFQSRLKINDYVIQCQ